MTFDEFVAKKDAARAERDRGRVTWRKVSIETGGGWSGIGSAGPRLVARIVRSTSGVGYRAVPIFTVWVSRGGVEVPSTRRRLRGGTLADAKGVGADLLNAAIAASTPEEGTP